LAPLAVASRAPLDFAERPRTVLMLRLIEIDNPELVASPAFQPGDHMQRRTCVSE
jgi:hypothetical protein